MSRPRKSSLERALLRSPAHRFNVVQRGTSTVDKSAATFTKPVEGEWTPKHPATRTLSERAPFAFGLSGIDPDRVEDTDYPWLVP